MDLACVFYKYFGIYCPGCGGTRAVEALFHGQILRSIWFHPLVFYVVCGMLFRVICLLWEGVFHVTIMKREKFYIVFLSIAMGIVLVNFILKNILLLCFEIKLI